MNENIPKGKVILAGAGPGDADLITLKLKKHLEEAELIITDRLVNPAIIQQYAKPSALVLLTGKEGFNNASYTQDEINQLMVTHALNGKNVLRLKGGDVAFFSNVLDELQALIDHNISFEIVPGVTAASGVSAYTGIPLTARGYSQGVHFITFNPNSLTDTQKWKYIAHTNDTLVLYMAAKNLEKLVTILTQNGMPAHIPIAIVEQATTNYQKIHSSTLQNCVQQFSTLQFSSPSMVIVGRVVTLHEKFNWFFPTEDSGSIFKQLE